MLSLIVPSLPDLPGAWPVTAAAEELVAPGAVQVVHGYCKFGSPLSPKHVQYD